MQKKFTDIFRHLNANVGWWVDYLHLNDEAHNPKVLNVEDVKHLILDLENTIKHLKELSY